MDDDSDLPLHDEAHARPKWRGDESIPKKGGQDDTGPASKIGNAAAGDQEGSIGPSGKLLNDLAELPPD